KRSARLREKSGSRSRAAGSRSDWSPRATGRARNPAVSRLVPRARSRASPLEDAPRKAPRAILARRSRGMVREGARSFRGTKAPERGSVGRCGDLDELWRGHRAEPEHVHRANTDTDAAANAR